MKKQITICCPDCGFSQKVSKKEAHKFPEHCPVCCEHDDHDHGICLDCGEDITQRLVARAEALCEGER